MQKAQHPDFHKKNILKREKAREAQIERIRSIEEYISLEYPIRTLSIKWKGDRYEEMGVAIEFYNQGKYEAALDLFKQNPPDPARFFKNMICTFYGPIGWLLMYNTRAEKNNFVNFCIGSCHYYLRQYNDALEAISNNHDFSSEYLRAWSYFGLGKDDKAKESFKKTFYANPKLMEFKFPYEESEVL